MFGAWRRVLQNLQLGFADGSRSRVLRAPLTLYAELILAGFLLQQTIKFFDHSTTSVQLKRFVYKTSRLTVPSSAQTSAFE